MTTVERNNIFFTNYFVAFTSIIYFIAKYFMSIEGEWGSETHPLSIIFQKIHILSVPFLLFFVGVIFTNHIWKRIRIGYPNSRTSGIFLLGLLLIMSLSGYAIQISDVNWLREASAYLHIGVSVLWTLGFTYHHMMANRQRRI